ncbi:unnamed protein product [Umbelopsis vinacea]
MVQKKGFSKKPQKQNGDGPVTTDPQFAHVHRDPRFMRPKRKDNKVAIDKRFASMSNEDEFKSAPKVDKYGRKLKPQSKENEMKRFYRLDEDEDFEAGSDDDEVEVSSDEEEYKTVEQLEKELEEDEGNFEDEDEESGDEDEDEFKPRYDRMRGEGVSSSSESEDEDDEAEEEEEEEEDIPTGDETHRLALVNLDWDKVKALDILKVLNGFKPSGSVIKSVTVYPSEFGKERMAKEEVEGPPRDIFRDAKSNGDSDNDEDGKEVTEKSILEEQTRDGDEFDSEKLRKYQLDRLKYYYAVVECDTVDTARSIYQACDGAEFERSANFFDLRYIPDEMTFEDQPRDAATHAPENYKPLEYVTDALQHSKVKLTWDEDDHDRINVTRRKFTKEDIEHMDFSAYLASSSEDDSDEDLETSQAKYKKLLASLANDGDATYDDGEEADGDMEITFTPGLSEAVSAAKEKKETIDEAEEAADETTIEKYMRKRKEKRMKKKMAKQSGHAEEKVDSSEGEIDTSDPWFKDALDDVVLESAESAKPKAKSKTGKKQTKEERLEEQRKKAELELLVGDSANKSDGFDMKEIMKREKLATRKGKLGKKAKKLLEETDDFEIDTQDPRFSALHESHHFAIDPTNPQFKKTKAMGKLMEARQKKVKNSNAAAEEKWDKNNKLGKKDKKAVSGTEKIKDASLAALVSSVKRKGALNTNEKPKGKRSKSTN